MIAALFLAAATPSAGMTKLIDTCPSGMASRGGCGDMALPVWRRLEADNGEVTKVDTKSVEPYEFGASVTVYTYVPGTPLDLSRMRSLYFNCRGGFVQLPDIKNIQDAPPRSVAGRIAALVCPIGDTRRKAALVRHAIVEQGEHDRYLHPVASDYCQGFGETSCASIKAGVEAKEKPPYCTPGFALEGSGLSREERRVCYARLDTR